MGLKMPSRKFDEEISRLCRTLDDIWRHGCHTGSYIRPYSESSIMLSTSPGSRSMLYTAGDKGSEWIIHWTVSEYQSELFVRQMTLPRMKNQNGSYARSSLS
jgi:hypothetical protein